MKNRTKSRELCLQILFQEEFQLGIAIEDSLNLYKSSFREEAELFEYAKYLAFGVRENLKAIDQAIEASSNHWKLGRMALIDKNILRIGVFEIRFSKEEVPNQVVISQAIELAKKFSSQESSGFVNGILDQIAKNS